jgi:hypothetical protein
VQPAIENAINNGQPIFNGLKPQEQQTILDIAKTMINKNAQPGSPVPINNVNDLINHVRTTTQSMSPAEIQSAIQEVEKNLSLVRLARGGYAAAKLTDAVMGDQDASNLVVNEVAGQAGITPDQARTLLDMADQPFDRLRELVDNTKQSIGP